jgi:hypothetical protein
MIRALKWVSLIGLGLALIGFIGLSMAIRFYPNSNLLGGWGLVLGPVYWLGLLICFVAVLIWIVVGLLAGFQCLKGGKMNRHGDSESGNQRH